MSETECWSAEGLKYTLSYVDVLDLMVNYQSEFDFGDVRPTISESSIF